MNRKVVALAPLSLLLVTCLVVPVSAFYFDFQSFETDKLVYEVGETINMVAKLIADFSDEGWCNVSFGVVTDLGPSFAEGYSIPPSPLVRYLNSSYTILPEHTSPTETGVQAFVIFTVQIFDVGEQSEGDNILITINRGHLNAFPQIPLIAQYGLNTSLPLKIASIHNSDVVYSGESVTLHVENSTSHTVLHTNVTTTSEGMVHLNWSDSFGAPGLYNLTVSSDGNEDFLPLADSFELTVLPAPSNLTAISTPGTVYCQAPDGSHVQLAEIIVEHTDVDSIPINDSLVRWTASFGSGSLAKLGAGLYSGMIPFNTSPGSYTINITSTNPQYQSSGTEVIVDVLANILQFTPVQSSWNVTRGDNVTVEFLLESTLDWNQSIQLDFIDEKTQFSVTSSVLPGIPKFQQIPIWHNISVGQHIVDISSTSEYYEFTTTPQIELVAIGTMNVSMLIQTVYYSETLDFNLDIVDDDNQLVSNAEVSIFCDEDITSFATTGYVNTSANQTVGLPLWIQPGIHNLTFIVNSQYYESIIYIVTIKVWMRTNLTIVISSDSNSIAEDTQFDITLSISSGLIMSPPPILCNGVTSTIPFTARLTSFDN